MLSLWCAQKSQTRRLITDNLGGWERPCSFCCIQEAPEEGTFSRATQSLSNGGLAPKEKPSLSTTYYVPDMYPNEIPKIVTIKILIMTQVECFKFVGNYPKF